MEHNDTLLKNFQSLKGEKPYEKQWFLVGSKFKLEKALMLEKNEDGGLLIPLSILNYPRNDFFTKINSYITTKLEIDYNYYLLVLKIVSLTPRLKIKQLNPADTIFSNNPGDICQELLHILSLIYNKPFKLFPVLEDSRLTYTDLNYLLDKKISNFFNEIFDLREEQYNILMRSYSFFNKSLLVSYGDITLAIILLVSSLENLANKYEKSDTNYLYYDEKISFHQNLDRILNKSYKSYIEDKNRELVFNAILESYNKIVDKSITKKFLSFVKKYLDTNLSTADIEEIFKNLYSFRSKYLHSGKQFSIPDKKTISIFNVSVKKHNKYLVIPSYDSLTLIIRMILLKFTDFLYDVHDNESDRQFYTAKDVMQKHVIKRRLKKGVNQMKAGYVVKESELESILLVEKIKILQKEYQNKK